MLSSVFSVSSVVEILSTELNGHTRSRGHVRSGGRSLLAGHAAADCIHFQANVLGRFDGAAHRLAYKRRHFDSALLYVQDNGSAGWQFC